VAVQRYDLAERGSCVARVFVVLPLTATAATGCGIEPSGRVSQRSPAPAAGPASRAPSGDPLASWTDGPSKKAIVDFVGRVTREGGLDYVAVPDRIATFDNDGTLWAEQPTCVQFAFALDRVKAFAPQHPDWKLPL
jgi:hypothetical protein